MYRGYIHSRQHCVAVAVCRRQNASPGGSWQMPPRDRGFAPMEQYPDSPRQIPAQVSKRTCATAEEPMFLILAPRMVLYLQGNVNLAREGTVVLQWNSCDITGGTWVPGIVGIGGRYASTWDFWWKHLYSKNKSRTLVPQYPLMIYPFLLLRAPCSIMWVAKFRSHPRGNGCCLSY